MVDTHRRLAAETLRRTLGGVLLAALALTAWVQDALAQDAAADPAGAPPPSQYVNPFRANPPAAADDTLLRYRRDEAPQFADEGESHDDPAAGADANPLRSIAAPTPTPTPEQAAPFDRYASLPAEPVAEAAQNTTLQAGVSAAGAPEAPAPPLASNAAPMAAEPIDLGANLPTTEMPMAPQSAAAIPLPHFDPAIAPASHDADSADIEDDVADETPGAIEETGLPAWGADVAGAERRLAPLGSATAGKPADAPVGKSSGVPQLFSRQQSLTTAGAGLAIVVGLFLICMWLMRRGGARSTGVLPSEAFAVLGRAPLTAQSFAHLVRVGNKLVLVAITAEGAHPLTEVTDPMEVDRILGLCASARSGYGPAAEFQQVLAQLSREPARGFLGKEAAGPAKHRRGA